MFASGSLFHVLCVCVCVSCSRVCCLFVCCLLLSSWRLFPLRGFCVLVFVFCLFRRAPFSFCCIPLPCKAFVFLCVVACSLFGCWVVVCCCLFSCVSCACVLCFLCASATPHAKDAAALRCGISSGFL